MCKAQQTSRLETDFPSEVGSELCTQRAENESRSKAPPELKPASQMPPGQLPSRSGFMLYHFRDKTIYWWKIAIFHTPLHSIPR